MTKFKHHPACKAYHPTIPWCSTRDGEQQLELCGAYNAGRVEERALVVTFLLSRIGKHGFIGEYGEGLDSAYDGGASRIERGEHEDSDP